MPNSYGPYLSKITLPNGTTYDIKDAEARELIAQIAAGGLSFVISTDAASTPAGITWVNDNVTVTGTLTASDLTKPYIYLVPHEKDHSGNVDFYREYVTVNFGTQAVPAWAWEFLGDTDIDLSGLGQLAWKSSASGNVTIATADSAAFSNGAVSAEATYTPTGSISVTLAQTSTAASLTRADYTPAGSVSKPNITVTPSTTKVQSEKTAGSVTAGSAASFTSGTFSGGSCTKAADTFVAPTLTTSVADETLTIGFTAGSFTEGALSFTPASHGSDTFTANTPTSVTLPTFEEKTVMTNASAALAAAPEFTGTTETGLKVTAASYDKATVSTQTFTGTEATISSTGTATGDVTLTKTDKTKTVTVS